jgi:hypothetical protein
MVISPNWPSTLGKRGTFGYNYVAWLIILVETASKYMHLKQILTSQNVG